MWQSKDLYDLDQHVERCLRLFPEKPVCLGLYLHGYGDQNTTLPMDRVRFQFKGAKRYLEEGKIEGIQILGSYLAEEFESEQAKWVAEFVAGMAR